MNKIKHLFVLLLVSVLVSAFMPLEAVAQSTIVGAEYKPDKNITEYYVFPYGEVALPGKWEKWQYNANARQQFFINDESVLIAISFGAVNDYDFNKKGTLKGYDFVKAYYDWELNIFLLQASKVRLLRLISQTRILSGEFGARRQIHISCLVKGMVMSVISLLT